MAAVFHTRHEPDPGRLYSSIVSRGRLRALAKLSSQKVRRYIRKNVFVKIAVKQQGPPHEGTARKHIRQIVAVSI